MQGQKVKPHISTSTYLLPSRQRQIEGVLHGKRNQIFTMNFLKNNILVVLAVVAVAGAGSSYYFYNQFETIKQNPQAVTQKENDILVAKLGQLMVLPDEQPTIATVADPEKLKDQPFFANAKKGDRVFIFTNAKKAVLYDEVANKIVEVAPINIGSTDKTSITK